MDYDMEELEEIVSEGVAHVGCTNPACNYSDNVEPDGDYECPECHVGRLTSPLVELGLI